MPGLALKSSSHKRLRRAIGMKVNLELWVDDGVFHESVEKKVCRVCPCNACILV